MGHIVVKKGLDIPLKGKPEGLPQWLVAGGESTPLKKPEVLALDLVPFEETKFRLLVQVGDQVKLGQPLVEDKSYPGRYFVSPAGGTVREIRRGVKRRLLDISIQVEQDESFVQHELIDLNQISRQQLIDYLMQAGVFTRIFQRPFGFLAQPDKVPRSIFVKAIESAPFRAPAEMQVSGYEREFQKGLDVLRSLTEGKVHLIYHVDTSCHAFHNAKNVEKHTAEGPHPVANSSLHIQTIDPVLSSNDVIWTLDALTVVSIGFLITHGRYFVERVIGIGGEGVIDGRTGFFKVREGFPISSLISNRIKKRAVRCITGDPLTGRQVDAEDFLGFQDVAFSVVLENTERAFLHFFGAGIKKYSFSRAYLSGHFNNEEREYVFTTNQHGEHRPFIDGVLYDEVMPLDISTINLVKAILAEDFDLAVELGLLEVDSEDFALPTFVCPSKMEMVDIVKKGLQRYAAE